MDEILHSMKSARTNACTNYHDYSLFQSHIGRISEVGILLRSENRNQVSEKARRRAKGAMGHTYLRPYALLQHASRPPPLKFCFIQ
jgi:hypothetical protein